MTEPKALAHFAIYDTVENILRDEPRGRLLDVPAGEGALALRLSRLGFEISCCDLYTELFRLDNIDIHSGNLDARLPYDDGSFDYIVCVEGLEHIESPANAIREFARILSSGGKLIVSVPNIMNIEERLKWLLNGYTSHFKPISSEVMADVRRHYAGVEEAALHVNPIGYSELRFLLEKNGFYLEGTHIDKAKKNSWAYWPVVAIIRLLSHLSPKEKRKSRWADELNSNEVLLGGNTLIFSAKKL